MATNLGFDCGTFNLVVSRRDGTEIKTKREINAFLEMAQENKFMFNILKASKVPIIERDNIAYVIGEAAVNMAFTLNLDLKRPMKDGCLNPNEKNAFRILSIMIHSLIGKIPDDRGVVYYSVPANAINSETDADYHSQVLQSIFKSYKLDGKTIEAHPINEGLAIIYAELAEKNYTGLGCSFGAGMVNVCYAIYGVPVFTFAITNSGDFIDKMAAKATGESTTYINQKKMDVDLTQPPTNMVERAIQTQYKILIENTVTEIKKGIEKANKKTRTDKPIDFVVAGGTSLPNGFDTMFKEVLTDAKIPLDLGNVYRPHDPLYSVARGALIAAENSQIK